jgi:hypothetical protein
MPNEKSSGAVHGLRRWFETKKKEQPGAKPWAKPLTQHFPDPTLDSRQQIRNRQ